MLKISEAKKAMIDYFMELGRVPTRSEYRAAGDAAPVPYKLINRQFRGQSYNTVLRGLQKHYPVEWASIGSKPVEAPEAKPVPEPVVESILEPASEDDLTPLEKLRSLRGESSE